MDPAVAGLCGENINKIRDVAVVAVCLPILCAEWPAAPSTDAVGLATLGSGGLAGVRASPIRSLLAGALLRGGRRCRRARQRRAGHRLDGRPRLQRRDVSGAACWSAVFFERHLGPDDLLHPADRGELIAPADSRRALLVESRRSARLVSSRVRPRLVGVLATLQLGTASPAATEARAGGGSRSGDAPLGSDVAGLGGEYPNNIKHVAGVVDQAPIHLAGRISPA